jgi:hypothetical protein
LAIYSCADIAHRLHGTPISCADTVKCPCGSRLLILSTQQCADYRNPQLGTAGAESILLLRRGYRLDRCRACSHGSATVGHTTALRLTRPLPHSGFYHGCGWLLLPSLQQILSSAEAAIKATAATAVVAAIAAAAVTVATTAADNTTRLVAVAAAARATGAATRPATGRLFTAPTSCCRWPFHCCYCCHCCCCQPCATCPAIRQLPAALTL